MCPINRKKTFIFLLLLLTTSLFSTAQQLSLPFFDDFSKPGLTAPDSILWYPSGVTINNTYAINPPTPFVATFDGRNASGFPYDTKSQSAVGKTDSLISKPIDLSKYSSNDSLVLSFYWQPKGLGDLPDKEDSLKLHFRNNKNQWVSVWRNDTIKISDVFYPASIEIKDTSFFHKNFQIAFFAEGRQSGAFDTWHIDYLYLDKGRAKNSLFFEDIAVQKISSLLKNYRSMPINQFLVNPANELNDSLTVTTNNLRKLNTEDGNLGGVWTVTDTITKKRLFYDDDVFEFFKRQSDLSVNLKSKFITPLTKSVLRYGFKILSTDNQKSFVNSSLLLQNDSLFNYSTLDNYYAYDDGTAEVGADIGIQLGNIAVQYILNKPDTLSAVKINFSPYFSSISGIDFLLSIYSSKNGKPENLLFSQKSTVKYASNLNEFVEYPLAKNIAITDTFYVSWQRLSSETVAVGFDKNSPQFSNKIFYNLGQSWVSNIGQNGLGKVNGSFMVRPIMGAREIDNNEEPLVPLASEIGSNINLFVYPNPSSSQINWNIRGEVSVTILDLSGKNILSKRTNDSFIDVSNLNPGMYILLLDNKIKTFSKKIIIQK